MGTQPELERLLCHAEWLARLARSLVRDASIADDLVQETWIAAIRRPPDPARPARPRLAGVMRKLAALRMRREGVRAAYTATVEGSVPAADETALQVERQRALAGAVLALEEPYRSAVLLRYYRGHSAARIARDLGVPSATVRTRLKRGLARLREDLDHASGGDGRSWVSALAPLASLHSGALTTGVFLFGASMMVKWIAGMAIVLAALAGWWIASRTEPGASQGSLVAVTPEHEEDETETPRPNLAANETGGSMREPVIQDQPELATAEATTVDTARLTVHAVARTSGEPLASVRVHVLLEETDARGGWEATWAKTDPAHLDEIVLTKEDGLARFDVLPGKRLHLNVRGEWPNVGGLELALDALDPGKERDLVVELPIGPDLRFVGRVLDDATGEPLTDAPVIVPEGQSSGGIVHNFATTHTDSDGYYVLDGLSWGRQHAQIDAHGYGRTLCVLTTGHETRETAQSVGLLRAASFLVQVNDAAGAPLEGREVFAQTGFSGLIRPRTSVGDTTGFNPKWTVTTDSGGRAELTGLPPGVGLDVELRENGVAVRRIDEPVVLSPGEQRELTITLGGGAYVFGHVRDEAGTAVADLEVWLVAADVERPRYLHRGDGELLQQRATTDGEGSFAFEGVPAGEWLVGPRAKGREEPIESLDPAPLARLVSISHLGGAVQIDLDVVRGLSIRGRVLGADGAPREGYWVRLRSEGIQGVGDFLSDSAGDFVVGPLARTTFSLQAHGRAADRHSPIVEARAGQEELVTLVLEPGAEMRGRTLDAKTGEGCAAEVRLIPEDGPQSYAGWGGSTLAGDFHFQSLSAGTYHVLARTDDGRIALLRGLRVETGTLDDVEIRLEPGAILVVSDAEATESRGFGLVYEGVHAGHGFVGPAQVSQQTLFAGRTILQTRGESEIEITLDLVPGERRELDLPEK